MKRQRQFHVISPIILAILLTLGGCDSWNQYWWAKQAEEAQSNGDNKKAVDLYQKLIEVNPNEPNNYWNLAILYLDTEQEKKALEIRDKLKKVGRDDYAQRLDEVVRSSQQSIHRVLKKDERAVGF